MKAWVLYDKFDLRLTDVATPKPKDFEALVEIKSVGICSSDISRVYGNGAYHYPIILGHEFSGVTKDGRRVGVFPLLPCRRCESCRQGSYETCAAYSYIGSRCDGAFAEYVCVPEWNLIDLPDSVTFEQAALIEPAAVALHAVKRLDDSKVNSAAIIGNGTIGSFIAKWLEIFGMKDVALLGRADAPLLENYDACFEAAGTADAFNRCINLTKPNGEIVLVGNPEANFHIDQKRYWQILRNQLTVKGVWNSRYPSDFRQVIEYAKKLGLENFISRRYHFHELDQAFDLIRNKQEKIGKVMITH